jgi:hypothetical protein
MMSVISPLPKKMATIVVKDASPTTVELTYTTSAAKAVPLFSQFLLRDNPFDAPQSVLDNKAIFWQSAIDTMRDRPMVLNSVLKRYMTDVSEKTFGLFPIRYSPEAKWTQKSLRFAPNTVYPGTRKVPGREIGFTVTRSEYTALYTSEGFDVPFDTLKTAPGMAFFDMMLGQVMSDIMRIIVYNMLETFMQEPTPYLSPGLRFAHEALIPNTPETAFDYFHNQMALALMKGPYMINNLLAQCNRMFEAAREAGGVRVVVMSEELKRYIVKMDESRLLYSASGPAAIRNRADTVEASIIKAGLQVMTIQMLGEGNDNIYNRALFTDRWQMGGMAHFVEPSAHVCPKKYKSEDRNGMWSSWHADRPEEHSFLEALRHQSEFIPDDWVADEEEPFAVPGELDHRLLFGLAANMQSMHMRTHCRIEGNEEAAHQCLQVVGDGKAPIPILTFGEISPAFLSDKNLNLPFCTARERIVERMSESDIKTLEEGFALAKRLANPPWNPNQANLAGRYPAEFAQGPDGIGLSNPSADGFFDLSRSVDINIPYGMGTYAGMRSVLALEPGAVDPDIVDAMARVVPVFERLVTVLIELNKTHPALDAENVPYFHAAATEFERVCIAAWNFLIEGGMYPHTVSLGAGLAMRTLLHFDVTADGVAKDHAKLSPLNWVQMYWRDIPVEVMEVFAKQRGINKDDFNKVMMAQGPGRIVKRIAMASPWANKHFFRRWNAARKATTWDRIAQFMVLLQEVNLIPISGWWSANIAIPLGGSMVRPFETVDSGSFVTCSRDQLGFTSFSGINDILYYDAPSNTTSLDLDCHFRTVPNVPAGFIVMPRTWIRRILGGKGNRWANANPDSDGPKVMRVGTPEFEETVRANFGDGERLGQYSMFSMMQGYNHSIDNTFKRRHVPLTGFWDENYFVGMLADSSSFQETYDATMGINTFMFNYIFPELINLRAPVIRNPSAVTHVEQAALWTRNIHVHQITQWVKNPLTGRFEEINSSHPCGREENNIAAIQSGTAPVRREPRVVDTGLPPLLVQ